jgi:hypothetical protein
MTGHWLVTPGHSEVVTPGHSEVEDKQKSQQANRRHCLFGRCSLNSQVNKETPLLLKMRELQKRSLFTVFIGESWHSTSFFTEISQRIRAYERDCSWRKNLGSRGCRLLFLGGELVHPRGCNGEVARFQLRQAFLCFLSH